MKAERKRIRPVFTKRTVLGAFPALALFGAIKAHARGRQITPSLTKGPFYPGNPSRGDDLDLSIAKNARGFAKGEILELSGRVLQSGQIPVAGALVEIWQCDQNGIYLAESDKHLRFDKNFQGYGKTRTTGDGEFRFLTINPTPYPGRAPHIHFKVTAPGGKQHFTQMFVSRNEEQNKGDALYRRLTEMEKTMVTVDLSPSAEKEINWETVFEIVI